MLFNRNFRKVETLSSELKEHFDCDGCLWPGVSVDFGNIDIARSQFDAHDCADYINCTATSK